MNIGKLKLDFTHFVLIAVAIGVMILMRNCGRSVQPNAFAERMMKEKTVDSMKMVEERKRYQDSLREINGKIQLHESIISSQFTNLKIAEKRIDKLLEDQKNLPAPIPFDSTSSIVSNHWIENCAECFVSLKNGRDSVKQYIHERDELDNLYKKDTALKGQRIAQLEEDVERSQKTVVKWYNKYVKDTKPKAALLGGLEYTFSPSYESVGLWLALKSRKGKVFSLSGGMNNTSNYYLTGRLGVTIFGK